MSDQHAQPAEPVPSTLAAAAPAVTPDDARRAAARGWIENRPTNPWLPRFSLRDLWDAREVAVVLALRNVQSRYKQTIFGVAWAILQPLAGVAIFTILFGRLARLPSEGLPYPVFVYAGLALWLYFSNAATAASESLAQYRELVTKVYFPRLLAPLAAVLPGLIDLAVALVAIGVFMLLFGVAPSAAILLLPLWVVLAVLIAFGVGTWLSALNVQYRDVRNALTFLLQLWFFATPVVYGTSLLEGRWSIIVAVNPVAGLIEGFRWSLIGAPAPGTAAFVSLGMGALILVSGLVYFGRVERRFADLV